MRSLAEDATCD